MVFHLVFKLIGSVFKTKTGGWEDIGIKQKPLLLEMLRHSFKILYAKKIKGDSVRFCIQLLAKYFYKKQTRPITLDSILY